MFSFGRLKQGVHPVDALMSAFPAGTLTGAPKIRAMQLLNELEPGNADISASTGWTPCFKRPVTTEMMCITCEKETTFVNSARCSF
jgi:hypothetical protein